MSDLRNIDLSAANWRKSSFSSGSKECVEVAFVGQEAVGVRDSKNPAGPALVFAADHWDSFVTDLAAGRFAQS
ncbi:DUF397 domain-containing protein [Nocardia sp. X0981]